MHRIIAQDAAAIANAPLDWEKLRGRTVLIAGANGYVPQMFVHGLLCRNDLFDWGIHVIALSRSRERAMERFGEYAGRADLTLLVQDVCDPITCMEKVDLVIHAASPAGVALTMGDPFAVFRANVYGCQNLIEHAKLYSARLLYISSVDVYGTLPSSAGRLKENALGSFDHCSPRNIYAASKRAAETLCMCYAKTGGESVMVRPAQIMGGGVGLNDSRLHINMISQLMRGDEIVLKGDGTPERSFIYVTDAIAGMLTALLNGTPGEAYNVCNEANETSVLGLAEQFAALSAQRNVRITYNMQTRVSDPAVTQVVSRVCPSGEKLRELGWAPQVPLKESCARMMAYYGLEQ